MDQTRKTPKKAKYQAAIEYRWQGLTARAAVIQLNNDFPNDKTGLETYRGWFTKDGLLHLDYAEFTQSMQEEVRSRTASRLNQAVDQAMDVLIAQVSKKGRYRYGMIAQMAAKEILERVMGKPEAESGRVVVVKLTNPIPEGYVPAGYKENGEPITTVADAVAATNA